MKNENGRIMTPPGHLMIRQPGSNTVRPVQADVLSHVQYFVLDIIDFDRYNRIQGMELGISLTLLGTAH